MADKNWHAFDLHMHTLPGITGDAKQESSNSIVNFSFCNFIHSLLDAHIELYSITNHNYVHLDNYIICRYLSRKFGINSLLGVELDINDRDNNHYHMACIVDCDIEKALVFQQFINEKSTSSLGKTQKLRYTTDDIGYLLSSFRIVLIPHSPNKNPGIQIDSQDRLFEFMKKVKEGYLCVLDEKSHWDLGYLKNAISGTDFYKYAEDIGAVFFSDNKDWSPGMYLKRLKRLTFMNTEPSFKGLVHCLTNPTERFLFKEYIPTHTHYISKIKITNLDSKSLLNNSEIVLKPGFNCIIGKSGSGKSLLINLLKKYLKGNIFAANYAKYDNEGVQIAIFDENGSVIKPTEINIAIGESIFNKFIEAVDAEDIHSLVRVVRRISPDYQEFTAFNAYKADYIARVQGFFDLRHTLEERVLNIISKLNAFSNNYNDYLSLADLNIIDIEGIPSKCEFPLASTEIEEISKTQTYFSELKRIDKLLSKANIPGPTMEDIDALSRKFQNAYLNVIFHSKLFSYHNEIIRTITEGLKEINGSVSENAKKKSSISTYFRNEINTLADEIVNAIKMRYVVISYDLSVDISQMKMDKALDDRGTISISEGVDDSIFTLATFKDKKIYNTYGLSLNDDATYDLTNKTMARRYFDAIYSSEKFQYSATVASGKLFHDVVPILSLYFNGQDVKTLNSGDIAKTYLQHYFHDQLGRGSSIVIYDQLENDVDKQFIKTDLLSFISGLKTKVQLIVVTHDPIIAVNGDPVNYVLAEKDDDRRISYRSFVPESEERDELKTLADTVDGSKEVIRDRYMVYKGENL